jgi:hypothetical protein
MHPSGNKPEISPEPLSASMVEDARKPEAPSTKAEKMNAAFIYELRPSDVLLGRGSRTDQYPGNMAFREAVNRCKREYSTTVDHEAKRGIAEHIIAQVEQNHGRFLRRAEPNSNEAVALGVASSDDGSKPKPAWVMIDKIAAIEKTKQALREKGNVSRAKKLISQLASHSAGSSTSGISHGGVQGNARYRMGTNSFIPAPQAEEAQQPGLLSSFRPVSNKHPASNLSMEYSSDSAAPVRSASLSMPGTASGLLQADQNTRRHVPYHLLGGGMAAAVASLSSSAMPPSIQHLMRAQQLRLELQRQRQAVLVRQHALRRHLQGQSFTSMANLGGGWNGSLATLSPTEAAILSLLQQQQRPANQELLQLPRILSGRGRTRWMA